MFPGPYPPCPGSEFDDEEPEFWLCSSSSLVDFSALEPASLSAPSLANLVNFLVGFLLAGPGGSFGERVYLRVNLLMARLVWGQPAMRWSFAPHPKQRPSSQAFCRSFPSSLRIWEWLGGVSESSESSESSGISARTLTCLSGSGLESLRLFLLCPPFQLNRLGEPLFGRTRLSTCRLDASNLAWRQMITPS